LTAAHGAPIFRPVRGVTANIACLLAFVAAVLSGGGVARFTHVMIAHGGSACGHAAHGGMHAHAHGAAGHSAAGHPAADQGAHGHGAHGHGAHDHAGHDADASTSTSTPTSSSTEHDDCPICAELAFSAGAPTLDSPFVHVIALLAILHEREASQLPEPDAPDAVAARPPPILA
jgi:hypothetical protein